MWRLIKIVFLILVVPLAGYAQDCTLRSYYQKAERYKKRLYKHFIVYDRPEKGCIGDGIGAVFSPDSMSIRFEKEGFGLPATHLMIAPDGAGVPGRRLNSRLSECGEFDISWVTHNVTAREKKNHKFNWLDFGSETISELGWLFAFLATEYELKKRQNDERGMQRALENIFLSLQALRRLDMTAQFILAQAYRQRNDGEYLCSRQAVGANHIGWWNNCHRPWIVKVKKKRDFLPDYSGYSGFFIRSDASQQLEKYLHDPTDESWNVDAIGGAFGGLYIAPGSHCPKFDTLCYLVKEQHFPSHDQLISLFYGFLFIKKYIPPEATVTTCDGTVYHPLYMMQKISNSIMGAIENSHIVVPGSKLICRRKIKLSECEGGNLGPTIYGLRQMNALLQDSTPHYRKWQKTFFNLMGVAGGRFNHEFYLKETSGFRDISEMKRRKRRRLVRFAKQLHKEILILGNDLLFPQGTPVSEDVGGRALFDSLLCTAPWNGPCHTMTTDKNTWSFGGGPDYWPSNFNCDNVPGWEGSRWEEPNWTKDGRLKSWSPPRRSNGIDYLVLYNMYLLKYSYPEKS